MFLCVNNAESYIYGDLQNVKFQILYTFNNFTLIFTSYNLLMELEFSEEKIQD